MRSVVPILNYDLLENLERILERVVFQIRSLGHEASFIHDGNALDFINGDPLTTKVPFIIRLNEHLESQNHKYLAETIQKRFRTADIVEDTIDNICDHLLALPPKYFITGRNLPNQLVLNALKFIFLFINKNSLTVQQVANAVNVSKDKLEKEFSYALNKGIWQTVIEIRVEEAKRILIETDARISEIGSAVGIDDATVFTRTFVKKVGLSPRFYRQNVKFSPR